MKKRILSLILGLTMVSMALVGCGAKEEQNGDVAEEKYNVRIMSNNLWSCDTNTGAWAAIGYDCSAPVRAEGFVQVYSETMPDVIGTQECTDLMQSELLTKLQEEGMTDEVIKPIPDFEMSITLISAFKSVIILLSCLNISETPYTAIAPLSSMR